MRKGHFFRASRPCRSNMCNGKAQREAPLYIQSHTFSLPPNSYQRSNLCLFAIHQEKVLRGHGSSLVRFKLDLCPALAVEQNPARGPHAEPTERLLRCGASESVRV